MNKEQKIANLSTSDNPPSRVQSTTTIGATFENIRKEFDDPIDTIIRAFAGEYKTCKYANNEDYRRLKAVLIREFQELKKKWEREHFDNQ